MFWKLALTAAAILFLSGRTGIVRNPLVRLLLPRSWSARLSAIPTRWAATKAARQQHEQQQQHEPAEPGLDRRARRALFILALIGLAAWIVTTWMVHRSATGP